MPSTRPARSKGKSPARAATKRATAKRGALASSDLARRLLARLRPICLGLPETEEVEAWGHPTFRVGGKIFAGFGADEESATMSVKTSLQMQADLVASDERFKVAAYVGKHGWVELDLAGRVNWGEVEALVRESYRQIAPARLAGGSAPRSKGSRVKRG
jgi:predicted DNA-binding protein (MmcQ/YjbR family)